MIPLEPRHLGVPSGASEMISESCLAQTVHLSCTYTNTISKRTKTRFHLTLVTQEYHRVRPKRFMSLWYVWHKPCTYLALILTLYPNGSKRDSLEPRLPGVLSGAVKMISEPCLEQTVHLSCTNTNTISKRTETRFHLSLVT